MDHTSSHNMQQWRERPLAVHKCIAKDHWKTFPHSISGASLLKVFWS